MEEMLILVDDKDEEIGVAGKKDVHVKGLLHRAISIFIFNENGELILQRRAYNKYHSAGLWTNTCCSHPIPGESTLDAANRASVGACRRARILFMTRANDNSPEL